MNNSRSQIKQTNAQKGEVSVSKSEMSVHSGPLPDPMTLKLYNELVPGAAERILQMAEREQLNRHQSEHSLNKSAIAMGYLGIVFALFSVVIISGLVYYSISKGFSTTASAIGVGAIASVAGVFMFFKRSQKSN